jgi:hypothetical protein
MRRRQILTQTLLILSLINFALAAPAVVRERPEVRLDVKVTESCVAETAGPRPNKRARTTAPKPGLDR